VTWENSRDLLIDDGWRITPELPPITEGYERTNLKLVEDDGITGKWEYLDTLIEDRINRENLERQFNKSIELKTVENKFLLLCEQLCGSKTKLGFDILENKITELLATDPNTAIMLSVRLLSLDAEGKREGGLVWWNDIHWHNDLNT
jgi:hypothetical protein